MDPPAQAQRNLPEPSNSRAALGAGIQRSLTTDNNNAISTSITSQTRIAHCAVHRQDLLQPGTASILLARARIS